MSRRWQSPEAGGYAVAIPGKDYQTKLSEVEAFFGRPLACYSHSLTFEQNSYVVFFFKAKADADLAVQQFNGEPFDVRDKGRGSKWMFWFKGRGAAQDKRHSPRKF